MSQCIAPACTHTSALAVHEPIPLCSIFYPEDYPPSLRLGKGLLRQAARELDIGFATLIRLLDAGTSSDASSKATDQSDFVDRNEADSDREVLSLQQNGHHNKPVDKVGSMASAGHIEFAPTSEQYLGPAKPEDTQVKGSIVITIVEKLTSKDRSKRTDVAEAIIIEGASSGHGRKSIVESLVTSFAEGLGEGLVQAAGSLAKRFIVKKRS